MRYTPGIQADNASDKSEYLYSKKGIYMLKDGSDYEGYYYIKDGITYSGIKESQDAKRLYPKTTDQTFIEYLNLKNGLYYDLKPPKKMTIIPSSKDYETGYMNRYFLRKRNEVKPMIYEVDKTAYDSIGNGYSIDNNLYKGITFRWKISGLLYDKKDSIGNILEQGAFDTNARMVDKYDKELPGLRSYLTNFAQYFKVSKKS